MTQQVHKRFPPAAPDTHAHPVSSEDFRAARCDGRADDERLSAFLEVEAFMRDLAQLPDSIDAEEAYGRYQEWDGFTPRGRSFVQAASRDLGLEPEEIHSDAARSRF